jgi:hypothetical protein
MNLAEDLGDAEGIGWLILAGIAAYVAYLIYEQIGPSGTGGGITQVPAAIGDIWSDLTSGSGLTTLGAQSSINAGQQAVQDSLDQADPSGVAASIANGMQAGG